MGSAVRKLCCFGRDNEQIKEKAKLKEQKKKEDILNFLQGGGEAIQDDLLLFDKAFENHDVATLVDLLDSDRKLDNFPTKLHPWASQPKSLASLAATHLAILAAKEGDEGAIFKSRIRDAGGIEEFVRMLESEHEDRLHAAVVALSFLSVDGDTNCKKMKESGCMPMLIPYLSSPIEGLQAATAQILRGMFVRDIPSREEFISLGGVTRLVTMLDLPKGKYDPTKLFNQLEAIFHLEDLILEGGNELSTLMKKVKEAGTVEKLEVLNKVKGNEELCQSAKDLLVRLVD